MRYLLALSLSSPSVNNACGRHGRRSRTVAIKIRGFGEDGEEVEKKEEASMTWWQECDYYLQ